MLLLASTVLCAGFWPSAARAQPSSNETIDESVIVVTAPSRRGEVIGDIAAETELDEADISSYGASSIEDLLAAISPQTGSTRGRGGGRPVVLINGQRVSGFRELRDIPPEAIERVQVFPEELALRYGFRPDQRVINFILKENFASITAEVEHGRSTQGGFSASEIEATLTRIGEASRLVIDVEYEPASALLESERGIIQTQTDDVTAIDNGDFRTLIPETRPFEFNASYNRRFSETLSATLSGEYNRNNNTSLLGLPGTSLIVPADSPFARGATDETLFRYLPAASGALTRDTDTRNAEAGLTVNGQIDQWRWSLTGNYSRALTRTRTDRSDLSNLAARVAAGHPALDPFAPALGQGLGFTRDRTSSLSQNADATFNIAGSPLELPAGPATVSLTGGYEWRDIASEADQGGVLTIADLDRDRFFTRSTIDIPLTSRRNGVFDAIGDLSLNGTLGFADLSDFGGLMEYGYGLNWEPLEGFSILASIIGEEAAPSVQQLGEPAILTPNVSIFDFTTGQSVFVDRITGGNPTLAAEDRRDFKLGVNYSFGETPEVRLSSEYIRNRSNNVTSDFPLLTPEIEAAFPDRVVRDGFGNLVSIDARPVNFAEVRSERIRSGINLSGRIGGEDEGRRGGRGGGQGNGESRGRREGGGPPPEGAPPADQAPQQEGQEPQQSRAEGPPQGAGPGGRGRGGGGRGPGGGRPDRWQLSLYHTYRIDETVLIRPGVPELDLLDGSVTGGSSPTARHSMELEGGVFMEGIGFRLSGEYTGAARIGGTGLPGSSDLFFGDIATLNLRAFFNFDSQESLVEDVPFLRGSRLALRVDNVFSGVQRVTDSNGDVPLSFQPGFLDPRGRFIELSFRKRF